MHNGQWTVTYGGVVAQHLVGNFWTPDLRWPRIIIINNSLT